MLVMPQLDPDPDAGARETLRLIGSDPQNWVPDREGSITTSSSSGAGSPAAPSPLRYAEQGSARCP
jgi:FAD-dependent urate hydroxylase